MNGRAAAKQNENICYELCIVGFWDVTVSLDERFLMFRMKATGSFIISGTISQCYNVTSLKTTVVWKSQIFQIVRSFLKLVLCGRHTDTGTEVKQILKSTHAYTAGRKHESGLWINLSIAIGHLSCSFVNKQ